MTKAMTIACTFGFLFASVAARGADNFERPIERVEELLNEIQSVSEAYLNDHSVEIEVEEEGGALLRKVVTTRLEELNDRLSSLGSVLLERDKKAELRMAKDAASDALINNDLKGLEKISLEYLRGEKARLIKVTAELLIKLARPPKGSSIISAEESRQVAKRRIAKFVQQYSLVTSQLQAIADN